MKKNEKSANRIAQITMLLAITLGILHSACSKDTQQDDDPLSTQSGVVQGTVKDQNGNPHPGTRIVASKGTEQTARVTNFEGFYSIPTLGVGDYEVTLELPLTATTTSSNPGNITIKPSEPSKVDFIVQPEPVKAHLNFGEVQLLEEILDKDGNTPVNSNEPLYAANIFDAPLGMLTPIKAPDDHHVTLAEFKKAKGNMFVNCNGDSSTIEISLEGMIPGGTYTFWLAYLNKTRKVGEQINFMSDFVNPTNPPIGSSDGTENIAIADTDGEISITMEHASCILTDEVALVIPVLYHINGKTFGGGHVPDPEEVVQLLVYFQ